jgi:hypothetical protein
MKINIIITLVLAISIHTHAQNNTPHVGINAAYNNAEHKVNYKNYWLKEDSTPVRSRQYYLDISKKRRNTGFIFLGTGCALMATGFLVGNRNNSSFEEAGIGIFMGGSGVLFALGSIPFFISSAVNKQHAVLAISIQPRSSIASSRSNKNIPGISLNIPIH